MKAENCRDCSASLPDSGHNGRCTSGPCFRARVSGLSFGFAGGGGYGRSNFHDTTIKEKQDEIVRGAKEAGYNPVPVGKRWV